jgi:UDPglucose 6-dehydrogenase
VALGIIEAVIKANEHQKARAVKKIKDTMGPLKGKTICMLGLSFKPNTNDLRDAPSLYIINKLLRAGAKIRAYDPVAMKDAKKIVPKITCCKDAYDAAKGTDAIVIVTEWNQFRNLDLIRIKNLAKEEFFFDLRNIYEPDKVRKMGFKYYSVGRV